MASPHNLTDEEVLTGLLAVRDTLERRLRDFTAALDALETSIEDRRALLGPRSKSSSVITVLRRVVRDAERPLSTHECLERVASVLGRPVSRATVAPTLSRLVAKGELCYVGRGYAPRETAGARTSSASR